MFAVGVVAKAVVCTKLLLVLGYFIIRSELSREPSSKQLYPSRISLAPLIDATDEELLDIAQQIWKADVDGNRMKDNDVQFKYTKDQKFFTKVNEDAWTDTSTYAKLIDLFVDYPAFTGTNVSREQDLINRKKAFIDAIIPTDPINILYNYWKDKKVVPVPTPDKFWLELHKYWFTRYYRYGVLSSGFEHTFAGETYLDKSSKPHKRLVKGFHNWVRMYKEEQAGRLQVTNRFGSGCCEPSVEAIAFTWQQRSTSYYKDRSSLFIRTSPEVEIALSTLCLLTRGSTVEDCPINLDGNTLNLITIIKIVDGDKTINTSYPTCSRHAV